MGQFQPHKPMNTTSLARHFLYTYNVIKNQLFIYADAKDKYDIGFLDINKHNKIAKS